MTQLNWHAMSRLSISGPAGWAPVERMDAYHHSGDAFVRVESWPVAPDTDLDELAAAHEERLFPDNAEDAGPTRADVAGREGRRRTATWTGEGGDRRVATVLHALTGRRMLAVTHVGPAEDEAVREEAEAIIASLHVADPLHVPEEELGMRPSDGVDLTTVEQAWRHGSDCRDAATHVITVEETFGAARHYGVAMLPGADVGRWESLTPQQRDLVASVAWNAVDARLASGEQDLREALELAASHDLIVVITTGEPDEATVEWFAARPDRMSRLSPMGDGRVRLAVHDTAELADLVLTDLAGRAATASAVRRHGGAVVGQEVAIPAGASDDEVRGALASLLALPVRSGSSA